MDPKNQPQPNTANPVAEVLRQEQIGYIPYVRKASFNEERNPNFISTTSQNAEAGTPAPSAGSVGAVANSNQIKIIKTYKSDAAEAAKNQQASVAKIAIAETVKRQEQKVKPDLKSEPRSEPEPKGEPRKRNYSLLLIAIVLIAVGAAAIPTVQYLLNQKKAEVPVITDKTILPYDHEDVLTLDKATRSDLLNALGAFSAKPTAASAIEYLKFQEYILDANNATTTRPIVADIFAGLIGPNMPSALARSFDSDYMFGLDGQQNPKPFVIFKTSSYEQTFANMLHWENKMIADLAPVLNLDASLASQTFTDRVVINKDVRAVATADGTIVFLYGFLDNRTLIITTDPQTFQDLNNRYVADQFVQ